MTINMLKKLLLPTIAIAVMVGCSVEEELAAGTPDNGSDVPVNINFASGSIEENSSAKIIVTEDGKSYDANLFLDSNSITGELSDIDVEGDIKVDIVICDDNGKEIYHGTDFVGLYDDSTYNEVSSDLYKVDDDGKVIIDDSLKIEDINDDNILLIDSEIEEYLRMLFTENGLSNELVDVVMAFISSNELSVNDYVMIDFFMSMYSNMVNGDLNWYDNWNCDDSIWKDSIDWIDTTWEDTSWIDTSWKDTSFIDTSWKDTSFIDTSWKDTSWIDTTWKDTSWIDTTWKDTSWVDTTLKDK